MKKTDMVLKNAIISAIGILSQIGPVSALTLPDGQYDLVVIPTATQTTYYGGTSFKIGTDGNWQSSFTFGGTPSPSSQGHTDTAATVNGFGSGIGGDGFAGIMRIEVNSNTFDTLSFSKDTIFKTAGGDFAQYLLNAGDYAQFTGSLDKTSGAMTLQPTKRYGAINAPPLNDKRWQVDNNTNPSNTQWNIFSTSTATNNAGTITGTPLADAGDVNGDGIVDPQGVLVTGGTIGTDWGDFSGAQFFEVWRINLLARAINNIYTVSSGVPTELSVLANDGTGGTGGSTSQLTIISSTNGALGTTAITGGGTTVTYTAGDTGGSDDFTYTIQDAKGVQSTATVNITVTGSVVVANDDGPYSVNQGSPLSITISELTSNDSSSAGNINDSSFDPSSPTTKNGTAIVSGANVVYTPPSSDFVGVDSFTYTVQDDAVPPNVSDPATVFIDVLAYGQSDVGSYAPGETAVSAGSTNGFITADDLPPYPDPNGLVSTCLGGCYDFEISDFGNATVVQVVPPSLNQPISASGLTMLKYFTEWQVFDTSTGDHIDSAGISADGGCPAPEDPNTAWIPFNDAATTEDNVGHECLKYTISDNGPNDSNPAIGIVADPSGLSRDDTYRPTGTLNDFTSNNGCSISQTTKPISRHIDWFLVTGFLGILGWFNKKARHK